MRPRLTIPLHAILPFIGVGFFYLACRSTVPRPFARLLPAARVLLAVGLLATLPLADRGLRQVAHLPGFLAQPGHAVLDSVAMAACGTDLLAHGHNPYADFYLVDCLPRYGLDGAAATPLRAGQLAGAADPTFESRVRIFARERARHEHWPPSSSRTTAIRPAPSLSPCRSCRSSGTT